ncbi:MAG: nuclear transport factor 2 family protein [Methylocella sp.]
MNHQYEAALDPEQLARLFVARAKQGDVDGIVALYEPDAVLACPDGSIAKGSAEIREFYAQLLADRPQFAPGEQQRALRHGDLALISSRLRNGAITAEIARKQANGRWLWIIDQPSIAP